MSSQRHIARDISYAHSVSSKSGRAVVRLIENATGRLPLIKRAKGYEHEVAAGRDFWQVMVEHVWEALKSYKEYIKEIIAPMIIWLVKKDEMPFVDDQGKEALNFQISMLALISLFVGPDQS